MNKFFGHLSTVCTHKHFVFLACCKMGIYRQGITHDLSKFSPAEFWPGVKYFQGDKSPSTKERELNGYSKAWVHHQGRNRHHFEYWVDYTGRKGTGRVPIEMPLKYAAEMVADRYAACRTYHRGHYTQRDPLDYFLESKERLPMHETTKAWLESILVLMAEEGEDAAFALVKKQLKESRRISKN